MKHLADQRDQLIAAASAAQRSGKYDVAAQSAKKALDLDPMSVPAKFLVGIASARLGNSVRAAELLSEVLAVEPRAYEVLVSLSTIYREIGRFKDALDLSDRAVSIQPNDAQAHNNRGRCLLDMRRLGDAATAFSKAMSIQPSYAAAYYNLGKTRQLEGKDGEAARAFSQAASLAPTLENLFALGQMLLTLCDFESAVGCAQACVARFPESAAAHLLLCGALTETHQTAQAEHHLNRAIELDPNHREAMHMATRQRPLGYIAEANENLRRAIDQNPGLVAAYDALMQNHRVTEADRELVEKMLQMLELGHLSPTELVSIHYGLGKAFEDLKDFERAMTHYDDANRLTRKLKVGDEPFEGENHRERVQQMIFWFANSDSSQGPSAATALPILIIGMMRSGTSLAEQILSSHPEIVGAGEQLFWSRNWVRAFSDDDRSLERLGQEYAEELRSFGPAAVRITDKMPGNYMFAGLIHQALPNARFIHIRRNPVDTCLSIWATPNHMPHEGGNDKAGIVFVYRQYLLLMEHWRTVLPASCLLEVDYEDLVAQPEQVIRRMIEFCGLEWNDACLRPQDNKRLVATPSAWQVRQPFYGTSVAKWRNFEPWLGDFRDLLTQ